MAQRQKKKAKTGHSPVAQLSEPLQNCLQLLKFLTSRPDASPFLEPVDWELYGLTDYPDVIKTPMDLGTIQNKLVNDGAYQTPSAFASDVRLVWKNAMTYNRPDSDIYVTAEKLHKLFEKKFSKLKSHGGGGAATPGGSKKAKKDGEAGESKEAQRQERVRFSTLVNQLNSEQLGQLVELIQKECPEALNEEDEDELEIEINNIDSATLQSLLDTTTGWINSGSSATSDTPKTKKK